ncbi:MAG: sulfite exporter TauE/SafE family protein [Microcoleaceae cyanobacterium]
MLLDLFLIGVLGFLGSFGHCVGMCSPIAVAFSLSANSEPTNSQSESSEIQTSKPTPGKGSLKFHLLLNLGRLVSYALVGAAIGGVGSVLIAGGQMAGIGSIILRSMAILTGLMLVGFGLAQIQPDGWPRLPVLHPLSPQTWHNRLSSLMVKLSFQQSWATPVLLGLVWGLIPCGFLYTAQIRAAETGSLWQGMVTMLAFGLGTGPTMVGVGLFTSRVSADHRSQLYRLGGWLTLTIGLTILLRNGSHIDYTGHGALVCLTLALVARPLSHLWSALLRYRRSLGVSAFVLCLAHVAQIMDHTLKWNLQALEFMLPQHQWGIVLGVIALILMTPAALTSFDWLQSSLGKTWRKIHLLTVPALLLGVVHIILNGSHYLGGFDLTLAHQLRVGGLATMTLGILLVRSRWAWSLLSVEKFYVSPKNSELKKQLSKK